MAARRALWRATDFLVLSRVCVRAIRPVRISNHSVTCCRLSMPVSRVYFPDSGAVLGRLTRSRRVDGNESAPTLWPHHNSFSSAIVAAHARVRSVLPDMCCGLYHAGGLRAIEAVFWIFYPHSLD